MGTGQFDAESFYAALDAQRRASQLTWKQVAQEAKVSASTLTRMSQGRRPDVDSLAALLAWSGLKAESFIKMERRAMEAAPLAEITAHLRADPNLSPEAATALETLLKTAYERFRNDLP